MSLYDWYLVCIKDYLIRENIIDRKDAVEIVLNDSDYTFRIDVHVIDDAKRSAINTFKGEYEVKDGYLLMKFLNKTWTVKI